MIDVSMFVARWIVNPFRRAVEDRDARRRAEAEGDLVEDARRGRVRRLGELVPETKPKDPEVEALIAPRLLTAPRPGKVIIEPRERFREARRA